MLLAKDPLPSMHAFASLDMYEWTPQKATKRFRVPHAKIETGSNVLAKRSKRGKVIGDLRQTVLWRMNVRLVMHVAEEVIRHVTKDPRDYSVLPANPVMEDLEMHV